MALEKFTYTVGVSRGQMSMTLIASSLHLPPPPPAKFCIQRMVNEMNMILELIELLELDNLAPNDLCTAFRLGGCRDNETIENLACPECLLSSGKNLQALIKELKERVGSCGWTQPEFNPNRVALGKTSCGETYEYIDNNFNFCPYCGKLIKELSNHSRF